jgi:hypothetical protein
VTPVQCFVGLSVKLSVIDQMLKYGSCAIKGTAGGLKSAPHDCKMTTAQPIEIRNLVSCRIEILGRDIVPLSFDRNSNTAARKMNPATPQDWPDAKTRQKGEFGLPSP